MFWLLCVREIWISKDFLYKFEEQRHFRDKRVRKFWNYSILGHLLSLHISAEQSEIFTCKETSIRGWTFCKCWLSSSPRDSSWGLSVFIKGPGSHDWSANSFHSVHCYLHQGLSQTSELFWRENSLPKTQSSQGQGKVYTISALGYYPWI